MIRRSTNPKEGGNPMAVRGATSDQRSNAYNLFILVLTLFSLTIMVLLLLPLDPESKRLLQIYDNVICLIFLGDFAYSLSGSRPRREYFVYQRGWLDLLGSIPTLGFFELTALFRLARLSRLARVTRLLRGNNRRELVRDMIVNRGQYASFITLLAAGMILSSASFLVLQAESQSPDANIKTGADAIWWGFVTITTVGYGDRFPVTLAGRLVGLFVMLTGVGIIAALASILASVLVPPPAEETPPAATDTRDTSDTPGSDARRLADEVAGLRAELADLRAELRR
jgi:voltage-gated potassium channel